MGAGGHARVVLEIVLAEGRDVVGLLDPRTELRGMMVFGVPILGGDELLTQWRSQGIREAFIGVGGVRDNGPRRRIFEKLVALDMEVMSVIHRAAVISPSAQLGKGSTVLAGAVVGTSATLGANVLVNTAAVIEHDCVLGDHVHIATGARLAGGVTIGAAAHVGIGASVREGIHIGSGAVVGAGAVVVADVPENTVVIGVPARALRTAV